MYGVHRLPLHIHCIVQEHVLYRYPLLSSLSDTFITVCSIVLFYVQHASIITTLVMTVYYKGEQTKFLGGGTNQFLGDGGRGANVQLTPPPSEKKPCSSHTKTASQDADNQTLMLTLVQSQK